MCFPWQYGHRRSCVHAAPRSVQIGRQSRRRREAGFREGGEGRLRAGLRIHKIAHGGGKPGVLRIFRQRAEDVGLRSLRIGSLQIGICKFAAGKAGRAEISMGSAHAHSLVHIFIGILNFNVLRRRKYTCAHHVGLACKNEQGSFLHDGLPQFNMYPFALIHPVSQQPVAYYRIDQEGNPRRQHCNR